MTKGDGLNTFVAAISVIMVCATRIGPMPGFFIGGQPTPVPKAWPDTSKVDEILLKLPGTPPRVVIIWVVQITVHSTWWAADPAARYSALPIVPTLRRHRPAIPMCLLRLP